MRWRRGLLGARQLQLCLTGSRIGVDAGAAYVPPASMVATV